MTKISSQPEDNALFYFFQAFSCPKAIKAVFESVCCQQLKRHINGRKMSLADAINLSPLQTSRLIMKIFE
jgi:hypothetical protein